MRDCNIAGFDSRYQRGDDVLAFLFADIERNRDHAATALVPAALADKAPGERVIHGLPQRQRIPPRDPTG
jgi:hypothetical protein